MFLNVNVCAGPPDATIPKTPEILNSLMSLTSPPIHGTYTTYQNGPTDLLSPDDSTPGEESAANNLWPTISVSNTSLTNYHNQQQYIHPHLTPSTSLLTPTSDESPPPLTSTSVGPIPLDLPSPVNTLEATRSALIKEGLKLQITSKLQHTSDGPSDVLNPDSKVIKTELTHEDEERRRKRRERNKLAATKCRNKKKEMTYILFSESETVEELNVRLKTELERLQVEKAKLEKSLNEAKHNSSCKHVRKRSTQQIILNDPLSSAQCSSPFNTITTSSYGPSSSYPSISACTSSPLAGGLATSMSPCYASPLSSSSSYCSSTSPYSFQSLLSPSDKKDFVPALIPHGNDSFNNQITSLSSLNNDNNNLLTTVTTSTSLDYIEPTIPLESPSSPTKLVTTKSKASSRYHPYMYSTSSTYEHETVNNNFNTVSNASNTVNHSNTTVDKGAYCPSDTTYSYTTLDIKTNPFTYPCVSQQLDEPEQSKYSSVMTTKTCLGYRGGRSRAPSGGALLSRYSGYSLPCEEDLTNAPPVEGGLSNNLFPVENNFTANTGSYFPSCTYNNL